MLAKALLVTQQVRDNDDYLTFAQKAHHMAMDVLPSLHPKFASFKTTNGELTCKT